jgi:hypothetical protein
MNANLEIVNKNLKECWEYYMDYRKYFIQRYYSDVQPQDFLDWCYEELYECPNCGQIVLKDEQTHMHEPTNSDNVCDDCIENGGYYE